MTGLSAALAARCSGSWYHHFQPAQREDLRAIVRTAFIDTAACIFSGRSDPATSTALGWVAHEATAGGPARLLFGPTRVPAPLAALVNGIAGHALDYDDVGLAGHPSVVLVPALWAEHERTGLSGFALCEAYAKGYAVWHELQRRLQVSLHSRGWHPTAVFGVPAVVTALASARRLDATQTAHALGLSASMASGVVANFGSMTKPLHIGRAVRAGFEAIEWAQRGMDASRDALDGRAGLLAALVGAEQAQLDAPVEEAFESTLLLRRPGIKKYPVCYAAHRVVDGVLDLCHVHDLQLAQVESVEATLSTTTAGVLRHHRPSTLAEARFSLEFMVAAALLHRRLGLREVSLTTLADPRLQAFLGQVHTRTTDTRCPIEPSFALHDEVVLHLKDGRCLRSGPIRFALGHAQRPLGEDLLQEKLLGCVEPGEEPLARSVLLEVDAMLA